jgi:hypothetical protein
MSLAGGAKGSEKMIPTNIRLGKAKQITRFVEAGHKRRTEKKPLHELLREE